MSPKKISKLKPHYSLDGGHTTICGRPYSGYRAIRVHQTLGVITIHTCKICRRMFESKP